MTFVIRTLFFQAEDGIRDWRNWLAGPGAIRHHVMLCRGMHLGLRLSRPRFVGYGATLSIGRVSHRVHGVAGRRGRSVRLPASTSQHFRHFRIDWIPSATGVCIDMETRDTGENCRCRLVDFLCADLDRYPPELELT